MVFLTGWARRVVLARMFFAVVTADLISSVTMKSLLVVARESVRGRTTWVRRGEKLVIKIDHA